MKQHHQMSLQDTLGKSIVHAAYLVHKELGPGLLEKIYETCMAYELEQIGLNVKRQVRLPIVYRGIEFNEGLRLDLLVEDQIIIELKAVDQLNPVWKAQIISHLKLTNLELGYLINFNVPLIKNGIQRFRN